MSDYFGHRPTAAEFAALDDPQLPERFQNYLLDKDLIGEGAISFIYRASRVDGNRPVRLKVLRKRVSQLAEVINLFPLLKLSQQQYSGAAILKSTGAAVHNGILIFECEFFESVSLQALINTDAPFHPDLVALLALETINGLNEIHGVRPSPGLGSLVPLHRNLKPGNILISPTGQIRLSDVGLIDIADCCDKARLPLPYGHSAFEAPEQLLRDGYADRRSDVYALGLVMLEMITARFPYPGDDIFEIRQNIRENRRATINSIYPPVQDRDRKRLMQSLGEVIEKMTAHDPDKRLQTIVDVESMLLKYLDGSHYGNRPAAIADFLRARSFQVERIRKRGFIDKLFGG